MPKKILHIVTDEQFTDYAIRQFAAPELLSEFVLVPCNHEGWSVEYKDKCRVVLRGSKEFACLLEELGHYSAIVFHGMFWGGWQTSILQRVPTNVKVAWVFWGGDLYVRHEIGYRFLAPITKFFAILHGLKIRENSGGMTDTLWEIPMDLYKRVDYCITSLKEEYDFARKFTNAPFKHFWYSYYCIEDTIGQSLLNSRCDGNNIWIGNSSAVQNNHIDVLWHIGRKRLLRGLKNSNVIIPLSYGDPWVRNMVKRVGKSLFGKRLQTLEQYIPRNEYNALMLSCSTMIIGYLEPAANGNIMTALWLGMRVYLSEKSLAYAYYTRIGCRIFSIERDLNRKNPDCFARLSDADMLHNRQALMQEYGKQRTDKAVRDLVAELL